MPSYKRDKKIKTYRMAALTVSSLAVFSITSCGADPVEQAAKDACECIKPVYAEVEKVMKAVKAGDTAAMQTMGSGMQQSQKTVNDCLTKVRERHKEIDTNEEMTRRVDAKIKEYCPEPQF